MPRSKNNDKNITKESRKFYMSHLGFFSLQALAESQGLTTTGYLEQLLRQLAQEKLSADKWAAINRQAEAYTEERRAAVQSGAGEADD